MDLPAGSDELARLEASAQVVRTPCGAGTMAWRLWGAGEPLVLLHGGSGSWRHWARNIRPLAARHRVIAADLPGLGDSDLPPPDPDGSAYGRIVADGLRTVLDGIPGAGACDLVGFSFGGLVATLTAEQAPDRVRRLMIIGPGGFGFPLLAPPAVKVRHLAGEARATAHRANLVNIMLADPASVDALALEVQEESTVRSRFKHSFSRRRGVLLDALAGYPGPVHAAWGERDAFSGAALPDRIAALRAVRPDIRTTVVPGAGHWLPFEAPAAFEAWLDAALATPPG